MTKITIFEEAMCCSTGVCGPDPDKELVRVTNTVEKLEDEHSDVTVERANMSADIQRFLEHEAVHEKVESDGPDVLPITVVDGDIIAEGDYMSYDALTDAIDTQQEREA